MSTHTNISDKPTVAAANTGAMVVALAGVGLVGYGIMFLVRNFTGFIELGLTPERIGESPEQIMNFSENLYHYISHLQVALSGSIIALGIAIIALALFGIRRGELWALWAALIAPLVAVGIGLPLHYPYGFATLSHLGLIYLDVVILLVGTVMSYRALRS